MIEPTETVIQTNVFEPTMFDVMDQLITINNRLDVQDDRFSGHDDRFDRLEKAMQEGLETLGNKVDSLFPLKPMVLGLQTMTQSIQESISELAKQRA